MLKVERKPLKRLNQIFAQRALTEDVGDPATALFRGDSKTTETLRGREVVSRSRIDEIITRAEISWELSQYRERVRTSPRRVRLSLSIEAKRDEKILSEVALSAEGWDSTGVVWFSRVNREPYECVSPVRIQFYITRTQRAILFDRKLSPLFAPLQRKGRRMGAMRLPLIALLCFVPLTRGSQNVFDFVFRSASNFGKTITDPFFELARGLVQKTGPVLIKDPDAIAANKGIDTYIKYKGYPSEVHKIRTKDDVTLVIHRIPGRPGSIPVLLQHGVMCSSFDFVANLPSQSLGFILHDEGYDVWMLNSRGNIYSSESGRTKKHFYEYTWDELAAYDMPDSIDYILANTRQSKLHVIGHSRGTTITVAMLASKSIYNQKIRLAILLSPVIFLNGVSPFVQNLIKFFSNPTVRYALDVWTENRPVFTNARADLSYFTSNPSLCSAGLCPFANDLSGNLLSNSGNHNQSRLAVYTTHFPAGTSFNDLKHFMQMYHSKRFAYFDYENTARNLNAYGSILPPSYNLSRVSADMLIFYSKDDAFISVEDGKRVAELFKNNIYKNTAVLLPYAGFRHMDFLWSIHAKKQLYDTVIRRMQQYDDEHR